MKEKKRGISKKEYIKEYNKGKLEEAFKIALETRKFEIDLYWKRTGYFVIFIGAVFVGYYTILSSDKIEKEQQSWLLLILPALGFLLSLLWHMANRGSKFWQENWEAHIEEVSTHLGIPIFGIIKSRKHSIYNVMGQYPFSVSKVNQMVSLFITISWVLVFIKEVLSFPSLKIDLSFLKGNPFWIFIIVGLLIILLVIFQCRGFAAKTPKKRKNADYFYNYGEKKKCECHLWCKIKQLIKKIPLIESLS